MSKLQHKDVAVTCRFSGFQPSRILGIGSLKDVMEYQPTKYVDLTSESTGSIKQFLSDSGVHVYAGMMYPLVN